MIQYTDRITPEEYMELRRKVGWMEFPIEEAKACVENAYFVICVREDEKAIGVVRLLWDGGYVALLSDLVVDPARGGAVLRALNQALHKREEAKVRSQMQEDKKQIEALKKEHEKNAALQAEAANVMREARMLSGLAL